MTDDELKALVTSHETYMHERINGAYKAGVRHCLELIDWAEATGCSWATLRTKMEEKLKELYV